EMEAEARVADVPVANEKLEGVAQRRRTHGAEAQRPVGSGPEARADGASPPRRSDGVHVPVLTELLTEGDVLPTDATIAGSTPVPYRTVSRSARVVPSCSSTNVGRAPDRANVGLKAAPQSSRVCSSGSMRLPRAVGGRSSL